MAKTKPGPYLDMPKELWQAGYVWHETEHACVQLIDT
jgi:hypothetical protein